jgi:predicted nucleic acid-binding protein
MIAPSHSRAFFDTNILVYGDDHRDPRKNHLARALIQDYLLSGLGVVSTQVLQEYFNAVTRKLKTRLDSSVARRKVEIFATFEVVVPQLADIFAAIDLHLKHGFSHWDGLIVRMACQSGCRVLFAEDMQHGRALDGVEIVNPFL